MGSALEDGRVTVDEFAEATQRLSRSMAAAGLEVNIATPDEIQAMQERRRKREAISSWRWERRLLWFALVVGAFFAWFASFGRFWWLYWAGWQVYTYQRYRDERRAFAEVERHTLELPAARLLRP